MQQQSLFDQRGQRKYLTRAERAAFVRSALRAGGLRGAFCLTLALTGGRISEVLALTRDRIDFGNHCVVLETLKRRKRGVFRAVPVPAELLEMLESGDMTGVRPGSVGEQSRIWQWCRTTAWKCIKQTMLDGGIGEALAKPKALRHAFGVEAVQDKIAISLVQKWLGHAKIETTAIYADLVGDEERALAALTWTDFIRDREQLLP